jgi:hypothetical protein
MKTITTLHEARIAYLDYLAELGKKPGTIDTYARQFDLAESVIGADRELKLIKTGDVAKFFESDACLKKPKGQRRAQPSIDQTTRLIRMFLVWAKEQGHIETLPLPEDTPMGRNMKKEKDAPKEDKPKEKSKETRQKKESRSNRTPKLKVKPQKS